MVSDGLATRMGRRPGATPATISKGVLYLEMHERFGMKVHEIADKDGVSATWVREQMKKAREEGMPENGDAPSFKGAPPLPNPRPRRLSEGKLAHRAVLALRRDIRFPALPANRKLLWLDCVMEIHALGDDDGSSFGNDGDPFETHEEFAAALGGTGEDLEALLRRGLLARLPDGGIDLPLRIGLRPKEKPRLVPMFGSMGTRGMFQVLPGGLREAVEPSTETPVPGRPDATETPFRLSVTASRVRLMLLLMLKKKKH